MVGEAKNSPPYVPRQIGSLSKDIFRQNELCFITGDLLGGPENGSKSEYTVIGAKPTAEQHIVKAL